MENITHALEMMGQGMLGIFVVLGAIALLVALMQRIDDYMGEFEEHGTDRITVDLDE